MTTEYTHTVTAANGRVVTATSSQSGDNILTIVTIDGELHSQDFCKSFGGWTDAETEAKTEALRVALEVAE